jgi:hypothetical protein
MCAGGAEVTGWTINYLDNSSFRVYAAFVTSIGSWNKILKTPTWTPSLSIWYHIAVVRASGTLKIYIDGTEKASLSDATTDLTYTNTLYIGGKSFDSHWSNGNIDELRISKGIARWTDDFIPPTSEYS